MNERPAHVLKCRKDRIIEAIHRYESVKLPHYAVLIKKKSDKTQTEILVLLESNEVCTIQNTV